MNEINRQTIEADIVCVGFGPATGGFLTTLSPNLLNTDGSVRLKSRILPDMPLQVLCYERADDIGFGVSGVVSRARAIQKSFPSLSSSSFPMLARVTREKLWYLMDPTGASRRSMAFRMFDKVLRPLKSVFSGDEHVFDFPVIPPFMNKHGGFVFSLGQFNQWVGSQVMGSGLVQIWPGTPVDSPLIENGKVKGVRLLDQGTDKQGNPDSNYMPGMDVRADLTVVGDGPYGPVGRKLNEVLGFPKGHEQTDWAIGMKMVVELAEGTSLEPGTVIHTFGYPEPEIFGFLYALPERMVSLGIFVPSWFPNPVRTAYRYMQHWMLHSALWKHLQGGQLRSWGAKSIQESGLRGEPHLVGDGFARIGEGSGSTNILANSGVDEAWQTGVFLAESVVDLVESGKPFSRESLEKSYVKKRRESPLQKESEIARFSRDGFHNGVVQGLMGMGLSGFTGGLLYWPSKTRKVHESLQSHEKYFGPRISRSDIEEAKKLAASGAVSLHDAFMSKAGWPEVPYDGRLLMSHQDALLLGGKVQAPKGYRDHVVFLYPSLCESCGSKVCIEMCSGQAITQGEGGVPHFDREKCIHCGACLWNCSRAPDDRKAQGTVEFLAGTGGLHSAEN